MGHAAVTIRDAEATDIAAVRSVLVTTWHDTYDATMGRERVTALTDDWHSLANLLAQVERREQVFLIAERHGAVVATGSAERDGDVVVLWRLYVLPGEQSQGIGSSLFHALLDRFDPDLPVRLKVAPDNPRAIAFYERHGFVRGEIEREHLVMRRPGRREPAGG